MAGEILSDRQSVCYFTGIKQFSGTMGAGSAQESCHFGISNPVLFSFVQGFAGSSRAGTSTDASITVCAAYFFTFGFAAMAVPIARYSLFM